MSHAIALPSVASTLTTKAIPTDPLQRAILGFLAKHRGKTRLAYRADLDYYGEWCRQNGIHALYIDRLELQIFLTMLQDRHDQGEIAASTVARRFGTVNNFLRHAMRNDLIDKNPADWIDRPKVDSDQQYRTWLNPLELALMIKTATSVSPRDGAIAALMGQMGMRVGEVCSLDVEWIQHIDGIKVVSFIGKGNKAATIVIPLPVLEILQAAIGGRETGPLFTRRTGRRMNRQDVARAVDKWSELCSLGRHVTPHAFRRGFAGAGRARGIDRGELQDAMRHKDAKTTSLYLRRADMQTSAATHSIAAFIGGLSS